jgi:hypothetical protein
MRGLLVGNGVVQDGDGEGPSQAGPSNPIIHLTDEERKKVEDGECRTEHGAKRTDT